MSNYPRHRFWCGRSLYDNHYKRWNGASISLGFWLWALPEDKQVEGCLIKAWLCVDISIRLPGLQWWWGPSRYDGMAGVACSEAWTGRRAVDGWRVVPGSFYAYVRRN